MRLLPFRRPRPATRRGFSFIEMMVVFVIFGLVAAIGVPRFDYMRATTKMRSAETQITSMLATARATAIRRGSATVTRTGNTLTVTSPIAVSPFTVAIVPAMKFDTLYQVTITEAPASVTYDSRGLATLGASARYVFTRDAYADTVCVTRFGAVMKDGCL